MKFVSGANLWHLHQSRIDATPIILFLLSFCNWAEAEVSAEEMNAGNFSRLDTWINFQLRSISTLVQLLAPEASFWKEIWNITPWYLLSGEILIGSWKILVALNTFIARYRNYSKNLGTMWKYLQFSLSHQNGYKNCPWIDFLGNTLNKNACSSAIKCSSYVKTVIGNVFLLPSPFFIG